MSGGRNMTDAPHFLTIPETATDEVFDHWSASMQPLE